MIPDSNSTHQDQNWTSCVSTDLTETTLLGAWELTSNPFQTSAFADPNMCRDPVTYTGGGLSHNTPASIQTANGQLDIDSFHIGGSEQAIPFQIDYHGSETGFDTGAWATSVPLTSGQGLAQPFSSGANLAAMEPIMSTSWSQVPLPGVHGATPIVIPSEQYIAPWARSGLEAYPRQANDHLAHHTTPSFSSLAHFTLPESRKRMACDTSGAGVQSLNTQQPEYSATSPATSKTDCNPPSSAAAGEVGEKGEQDAIRVVKLEEATSQNRPKKLEGWVQIESEKDGTVYVKFGIPPSKPRGDLQNKLKEVKSYLARISGFHRSMVELLGQEDTLAEQLSHLASLLADPTSKLLLSSGVLTDLKLKLSVLLERCLEYQEPGNPTSLRESWKSVKDQQKRMHLLKELLRTIDAAFELTTRWRVDGLVMMG